MRIHEESVNKGHYVLPAMPKGSARSDQYLGKKQGQGCTNFQQPCVTGPSAYFSLRLSLAIFNHFLFRIHTPRAGRGLFATLHPTLDPIANIQGEEDEDVCCKLEFASFCSTSFQVGTVNQDNSLMFKDIAILIKGVHQG